MTSDARKSFFSEKLKEMVFFTQQKNTSPLPMTHLILRYNPDTNKSVWIYTFKSTACTLLTVLMEVSQLMQNNQTVKKKTMKFSSVLVFTLKTFIWNFKWTSVFHKNSCWLSAAWKRFQPPIISFVFYFIKTESMKAFQKDCKINVI